MVFIQGDSIGVLFNGLLAELPTISDNCFTSAISNYIGVVGWGWHEVTGKHTLCSYTCIMDPMVLEMAKKLMKSMDNHTARPCETL